MLFGKLVNGGEDRLVFVSFSCKEKRFQNLPKGEGILNDGFNTLINSCFCHRLSQRDVVFLVRNRNSNFIRISFPEGKHIPTVFVYYLEDDFPVAGL